MGNRSETLPVGSEKGNPMSKLEVTPLPGAFGAEISGVDLSHPLSEDTAREFLDIYFTHQYGISRFYKEEQ